MFDSIKIFYRQGKQFIADPTTAEIPGIFRGRPVISLSKVSKTGLRDTCPTQAISIYPDISIDLGKCVFCGECAFKYQDKIHFTNDCKLATNHRNALIIHEGEDKPIGVFPEKVRGEIRSIFGKSLKLRQVSAGGDNSCEWELNAANNVQFDMGRYGIEFVASPRHADGIVITGPITGNMSEALQICYDATPSPKIIVLVGTDAISGGIFADSPAIDRSFLDKYDIDLYIPGNPAHPLTIINGLLDLIREPL